jgi:hypothetical protein
LGFEKMDPVPRGLGVFRSFVAGETFVSGWFSFVMAYPFAGSFALRRKNSETLKPSAFANSSSRLCSARDMRNWISLLLRSAFGFGGRPMRLFFITLLYFLSLQ